MLISIDAGSSHPTLLGTKDLCASKAYENWAQEGRQQVEKSQLLRRQSEEQHKGGEQDQHKGGEQDQLLGTTHSPPGDGDLEMAKKSGPLETLQIDVMNKLLFQKLITVFCAILDAAAMSNNWIIIDRTNATECSATAELILEFAISQTNQRPPIVVIESMKRFRQFTSEKTASHLRDLTELAAKSKPITSDGMDSDSEVQIIPLPYSPDNFVDSKPYQDVPLPCRPFKEHVRADTKDVAPKRKWMYHYSQTTFASGTHYVFLENDTEAFPLDAFGPTGYVHAHGGTLSYQRLRSRISQGRPLVILHQTGGVSQAFGSLHKSIGHMSVKAMKNTDQILAEVDLFSSENWASGFGVPEIMMFKELLSRAPQLFQKTILSVDLVKVRSSSEERSAYSAAVSNFV